MSVGWFTVINVMMLCMCVCRGDYQWLGVWCVWLCDCFWVSLCVCLSVYVFVIVCIFSRSLYPAVLYVILPNRTRVPSTCVCFYISFCPLCCSGVRVPLVFLFMSICVCALKTPARLGWTPKFFSSGLERCLQNVTVLL